MIIVFVFLFYFSAGVWGGLSYVSGGIFRPIISLGNSVGTKFKTLGSYFFSKNNLYLENQELQDRLAEDEAKRINYDTLLSENISLKEILGRLPAEGAGNVVLGAILSKPNQSPYDTLVVDLGEKDGL